MKNSKKTPQGLEKKDKPVGVPTKLEINPSPSIEEILEGVRKDFDIVLREQPNEPDDLKEKITNVISKLTVMINSQVNSSPGSKDIDEPALLPPNSTTTH